MTFADQLKRWRAVKRRGDVERGRISQVQAAAQLGVPLRTYQDWELGRHEPPAFVLDLLTQKLGAKTAGRPVAPSNRKAKGNRLETATGSKGKSNHAKKKDKG